MSTNLRKCISTFCKSKWILQRAQLLSRQASPVITTFLRNRSAAAEPLVEPTPVGAEKEYPEKLKRIVDDISKLTLIEVADLNDLLKKTLNIKEVAMAPAFAAAPAAQVPKEEEEEAAPQAIKSSFTVKLLKYDEAKKVPLIKEIKNLVEGMNLVQAKKFVEAAPQVVKADIGKDEAEKLKAALEAVGGSCDIS